MYQCPAAIGGNITHLPNYELYGNRRITNTNRSASYSSRSLQAISGGSDGSEPTTSTTSTSGDSSGSDNEDPDDDDNDEPVLDPAVAASRSRAASRNLFLHPSSYHLFDNHDNDNIGECVRCTMLRSN